MHLLHAFYVSTMFGLDGIQEKIQKPDFFNAFSRNLVKVNFIKKKFVMPSDPVEKNKGH